MLCNLLAGLFSGPELSGPGLKVVYFLALILNTTLTKFMDKFHCRHYKINPLHRFSGAKAAALLLLLLLAKVGKIYRCLDSLR